MLCSLRQVDWRISLGRFQAPTNWTVEATKMSGIYPHFTKARWCLLVSPGNMPAEGGWPMHGQSRLSCPLLLLQVAHISHRFAEAIDHCDCSPHPTNGDVCCPTLHELTRAPVPQVPYISQRFAEGNHCDRDPHPETGQPRPPIHRHTELRLMCSPDKDVSCGVGCFHVHCCLLRPPI